MKPPMPPSLVAQYFLNHRLDLTEIEWQMAELARAGYQGVYAHARQGLLTPYFSHDWWKAMDTILACCKRHGLSFWIWDEDYFPSASAGGRVVWENPAFMRQTLEMVTHTVEGAGPFELDFVPVGSLMGCFAAEIHSDGSCGPLTDLTAYCGTRRQRWSKRWCSHRAYSPQIDTMGGPHWRTSCYDNHFALSWTPPHPGRYQIIAGLVATSTGQDRPNLLDRRAMERALVHSYQPYRDRYASDMGKTILGGFLDEPSPGGLYPWSQQFEEEFQEDHGYALRDELPHLAMDLNDRSPVVRHHYRLTQGRLLRENYLYLVRDFCHANKIKHCGHLTRTEWLSLTAVQWPNELRCYESMDIPASDPLGTAAAYPNAAAYHTGLKVSSSAAHLFGRDQAGVDSLAVIGEETRLRDLKFILDYQMALGSNHFVMHGASYSLDGPRKDEVPPSLFYQHSQWPFFRTLTDYTAGVCAALTGGEHQCSLAVLYPSTSLGAQAVPGIPWDNLDDEPLIHTVSETLLSAQRDFDFIDDQAAAEITDNGTLTTPEKYDTILLPYLRYMDERTAKGLERFAKGGGRVIAVGYQPKLLGTGPNAKTSVWQNSAIEFAEKLDENLLQTILPAAVVTGDGSRDIFVLKRKNKNNIITFAFNRRPRPFVGTIDHHNVYIAPGGSTLLKHSQQDTAWQVTPLRRCYDTVASAEKSIDISNKWHITFEDNHVPLNFWHVTDQPHTACPLTHLPAATLDLMSRQDDPIAPGDNTVLYGCRLMVTGTVQKAYLVIEDSMCSGQWEMYVNHVRIDAWQRQRVFDCSNRLADISHALRGAATPTLNVITLKVGGANRSFNEIPYLCGSFSVQYRQAHLSLPYLTAEDGRIAAENLQGWFLLGRPTYSGMAIYERSFSVDTSGDYLLDLGRVEDAASVRIDGQEAYVAAWPPYWIPLKNVSVGSHRLTITLCNAPGNRVRNAHQPAGLLGPVRLIPDKNQ